MLYSSTLTMWTYSRPEVSTNHDVSRFSLLKFLHSVLFYRHYLITFCRSFTALIMSKKRKTQNFFTESSKLLRNLPKSLMLIIIKKKHIAVEDAF